MPPNSSHFGKRTGPVHANSLVAFRPAPPYNGVLAMRRSLRKLLTCSLLATYAGVSLLGYGLHWLTSGEDHHHDLCRVVCTEHAHASHDHADHDHASPSFTTGGCVTDSHACEICEFLAHAVSQPPQIATTPDLHVLVADVPCHSQDFNSPTILGLHAPRGPPQPLA